MSLPERLKRMIHPQGFDRLFSKEISHHDTYEEAFRQLNSEFEDAFGHKRYKNYESYRKSREQRIKSGRAQEME